LDLGSIFTSIGAGFSVKYMKIIDILGLPLVCIIGFIILLVTLTLLLNLNPKLKKKTLKDSETLYIFRYVNRFIHEDFKANKDLIENSNFHPTLYLNNNTVKIHFLLYFY